MLLHLLVCVIYVLKNNRAISVAGNCPFLCICERALKLLSEAELFDDCAVTLDVLLLKVSKELTAMADHLEKSATAVVVLVVLLKMLGKVLDSRGEKRDLDLGGSGVVLVNLVSVNY